jgi:universal stress protein A
MKKVEKILAPTDLSELSRVGLEYALELASGWGAEVTVYLVANAGELASYKASSLEDLLAKHQQALSGFLNEHFAKLLPLVEVHEKVEIGSPATNIIAEAENQGSDLIVMSTHDRTGLAHVLMGSVTEQVVRNSGCPVFSVHPPKSSKAVDHAADKACLSA